MIEITNRSSIFDGWWQNVWGSYVQILHWPFRIESVSERDSEHSEESIFVFLWDWGHCESQDEQTISYLIWPHERELLKNISPPLGVILYYPLLLYKDSTPTGGSVNDTLNFERLHFSEMFRSSTWHKKTKLKDTALLGQLKAKKAFLSGVKLRHDFLGTPQTMIEIANRSSIFDGWWQDRLGDLRTDSSLIVQNCKCTKIGFIKSLSK